MRVEIWSDIACPWCYIGKRRFEAALDAFEHRDEVTVTWRSFELDPQAPRERTGDRAARLAEKYGTTRERAEAMQRHMTEEAAGEGLGFRFDLARSGNTFDAHRLLHLAAEHDAQGVLKERLLRAYLAEGEPIGDPSALGRLAVEAGLPGVEVEELLAGDRHAEEVRSDERTAAALGVTSVPFFVIDRAMGVPGAQPPEVLTAFLERGFSARAPVAVAAGGESCGIDGC